MSADAFPTHDTLCETCGYPLRGLDRKDDCPECGSPIEASHPRLRTGPPWQSHPGFHAFVATLIDLAFRPRAAFRTMRLDGSNLPARAFLLITVIAVGALWGYIVGEWLGREPLYAWLEGMLAAKLCLALTYVEALGVAYFSRQRGWRVTWKTAERIACYAALGWVPAAAVLLVLRGLCVDDRLAASTLLSPPLWRLVVWSALGGAAILGFETLVWLGVREVRYANAERTEGVKGR